jgi:hypothetical protein
MIADVPIAGHVREPGATRGAGNSRPSLLANSFVAPRYSPRRRRDGRGSVPGLLTGPRASGPEVLDAIEDLIECRFERSGVAANLREHDAAFDRG